MMTRNERVRSRWAIAGLGSLVFLAAVPVFAADDLRSAIAAANKKWEAAAKKGDGAGVAALVAPAKP